MAVSFINIEEATSYSHRLPKFAPSYCDDPYLKKGSKQSHFSKVEIIVAAQRQITVPSASHIFARMEPLFFSG